MEKFPQNNDEGNPDALKKFGHRRKTDFYVDEEGVIHKNPPEGAPPTGNLTEKLEQLTGKKLTPLTSEQIQERAKLLRPTTDSKKDKRP